MTQSILDHDIISQRYFFPRREELADPFWVQSGDIQLACYYRQKFPGAKTVIFFHGNGELAADYIDLYVPLMEQMGYNCFLAEYRGYGMSSGVPALVAMLSDVKRMVEALDQPPQNLVLFGRSTGSIYAVHGASLFPHIAGLVVESGLADLFERLLLRVRPEELNSSIEDLQREVDIHLDMQEKLSRYKGRSLIMHARNDSLVHFSHGQRLYEWASQPKTLKLFEHGDHNDIFPSNAQQYIQSLGEFLEGLA